MSTEKIPTRDRILKVAGELFYKEGFRAIGIDRVIAEADVAKATFYNHFPSKDDLIVAWVRRAEESSTRVLPASDSPLPLFDYTDALIDIARQSWCMGCTYQGTAAEFTDPAHPAHEASISVKKRVLDTLEERAAKQGIAAARRTAETIFLLLEGVWASVRMFRSDAPLAHAKEAVRRLAA
jgi:AcrR family transcriptional regulator